MRGFESQTCFRNGFRLQEGSASKGLANVITKQPLATPYYGFTQQFGSYDLYRSTLDATGPITKNKDLRIYCVG